MENAPKFDTEDKMAWCKDALAHEEDFVARIAPICGIDVVMNPEKAGNKYAADLWLPRSGRYADLKHQTTPFFTSERYGVPPQYAVTFNVKDYERYRSLYPGIVIYFWLRWDQLEYQSRGVAVEPMEGVWGIEFAKIARAVESKRLNVHGYLNRVNDTSGNAKASYIFDIRHAREIWRAPLN